MKLASETHAGLTVPLAPSLEALLMRLESLSLEPGFSVQREIALSQALQPYLEGGLLRPLAQETDLADATLFADFYPQDGQLTLIEQLRDVITEHIPDEERVWMDPLKHSYADLVEFHSFDEPEQRVLFRSTGNHRVYRVPDGEFRKGLRPGQILLTRLIREPGDVEWERAVFAGAAIVLPHEDGEALLASVLDYRRQVEITAGSFELGDWPEFAKRYGHVLLWTFARMRFAALLDAVVGIRYVTADGQPYLYVLALYDHAEGRYMAEVLPTLKGFERATGEVPVGASAAVRPVQRLVQRDIRSAGQPVEVAWLTLTSTQLLVECDSKERLDAIKHQLAATFGFSLHFRGEAATQPLRELTEAQLAIEEPVTVTITLEEDRALLNTFLTTVYLDWAERACPALGNDTPRHLAGADPGRTQVAALIDDMERNDPGIRRVGRTAFDYNRLRAHVGLEEAAR